MNRLPYHYYNQATDARHHPSHAFSNAGYDGGTATHVSTMAAAAAVTPTLEEGLVLPYLLVQHLIPSYSEGNKDSSFSYDIPKGSNLPS